MPHSAPHVFRRACCDETGSFPFASLTHTHASKQLSGDIMQLSPWRSAGDGPSLDNVKNVRLSLSICRFDFSLESCWEPEKMGAFGNAHARALKVRFKDRIYEKCWHARWIRELTFKKKKNAALWLCVAEKRLWIEDLYLNKKEHRFL